MFTLQFLNPYVMSLIEMIEDIGDFNVPDCFFIS